jgi:hypothetical protein
MPNRPLLIGPHSLYMQKNKSLGINQWTKKTKIKVFPHIGITAIMVQTFILISVNALAADN